MSKGKQLREGLTGACWWYAIGDHKVPHSGWMGRLPGSNPWARLAIRCQLLVSSIKVEVKKKHISCGWNFSCFAAHLLERDRF